MSAALPALSLLCSTIAAAVPLPQNPAALTPGPQQRYVDFSDDLDRPGLLAVLGTLGKLKEGRRERLEDGSLGSPTQHVAVSGTQYFKVAASAPLQPRSVLIGDTKGKLAVDFDLQLARLPDGKERRQALTGNGARIEAEMLGLWVLAPRDKGKGLQLLHVIPFDAALDKGGDPEAVFGDTMRDFVVVNQRVRDLKRGIAALEQAADDAARQKARETLQALVDSRLDLRRPELNALLTSHVWPYEKRARDRLGDAGKAPGKAGGSGG